MYEGHRAYLAEITWDLARMGLFRHSPVAVYTHRARRTRRVAALGGAQSATTLCVGRRGREDVAFVGIAPG